MNKKEHKMNDLNLIKVGDLTINYLKDGSATNQTGAFELIVPPGAKVPPAHSHSLNEEFIYILEGKLRYQVNNISKDLVVGETMSTPKGAVHGFSNPFDVPAKALVVLSPDVGAQYFRDIANVLGTGGPPDMQAIVSVMSKYGLRLPV
jgi:quercetin dioxygenase-like cupin family protein